MGRRFINQLADREDVHEVFLASEKQLRPNRNGHLYLQVRLSDRTGSINAMMWNATDRIYQTFENGDYVQVQGTAQVYNGNLQVIISQIDAAEQRDVHEDDFVHLGERERARLLERLQQLLAGMRHASLRHLAETFFADTAFVARFIAAPAGIKHHHAYAGGLLEHVVSLAELALTVAPRYPNLDSDLLLMGAFLHDIGKIEELLYDRALSYSDEGQLVGHLVQGVSILERKLVECEARHGRPVPRDVVLHLKHMIVSHHGKLEFGSPKVPMTLEAVTLHYLDDLDAKLHAFEQLIREDVNVDSDWTSYHAQIGRKLFKPRLDELET